MIPKTETEREYMLRDELGEHLIVRAATLQAAIEATNREAEFELTGEVEVFLLVREATFDLKPQLVKKSKK